MLRENKPEERKFAHNVLKILRACAIGTIAVDSAFGGHLQEEGDTRFIHPDKHQSYEHTETRPPLLVIGMPGFMASAHGLSGHLDAILPPATEHVTIQYGNDFSISSITSDLLARLHEQYGNSDEDIPDTLMYGHSMGGYFSVLAAAELARHKVPIKAVVLDSSPNQLSDIQGRFEQLAVSGLSKVANDSLPGGLGIRGVLESPAAFSDSDARIDKRLLRIAKSTLPKTREKSNVVAMKISRTFSQSTADFDQAVATLKANGVRVVYCAAARDASHDGETDYRIVSDGVVNTPQAIRSWQHDFPELEIAAIMGGSHGISWTKRGEYSDQIGNLAHEIRSKRFIDEHMDSRRVITPIL